MCWYAKSPVKHPGQLKDEAKLTPETMSFPEGRTQRNVFPVWLTATSPHLTIPLPRPAPLAIPLPALGIPPPRPLVLGPLAIPLPVALPLAAAPLACA